MTAALREVGQAGGRSTGPAPGSRWAGAAGGNRTRVSARRNRPDTREAAGALAHGVSGASCSSCAFLRVTTEARVTLCQADAPLSVETFPLVSALSVGRNVLLFLVWSRQFLTDCFPQLSLRRPD